MLIDEQSFVKNYLQNLATLPIAKENNTRNNREYLELFKTLKREFGDTTPLAAANSKGVSHVTLTVRSLKPKRECTLDADETTTVRRVKQRLSEKYDIPIHRQRLVMGGQTLQDDELIALKIQLDGLTTVYLFERTTEEDETISKGDAISAKTSASIPGIDILHDVIDHVQRQYGPASSGAFFQHLTNNYAAFVGALSAAQKEKLFSGKFSK